MLRLGYLRGGHLWTDLRGRTFPDLGSQRQDDEDKGGVSSANSTFRFKYGE